MLYYFLCRRRQRVTVVVGLHSTATEVTCHQRQREYGEDDRPGRDRQSKPTARTHARSPTTRSRVWWGALARFGALCLRDEGSTQTVTVSDVHQPRTEPGWPFVMARSHYLESRPRLQLRQFERAWMVASASHEGSWGSPVACQQQTIIDKVPEASVQLDDASGIASAKDLRAAPQSLNNQLPHLVLFLFPGKSNARVQRHVWTGR